MVKEVHPVVANKLLDVVQVTVVGPAVGPDAGVQVHTPLPPYVLYVISLGTNTLEVMVPVVADEPVLQMFTVLVIGTPIVPVVGPVTVVIKAGKPAVVKMALEGLFVVLTSAVPVVTATVTLVV